MGGETVVVDGELSLILEGIVEPELLLPESGECGVFIAMIPSNYGLITWNGSILTVS